MYVCVFAFANGSIGFFIDNLLLACLCWQRTPEVFNYCRRQQVKRCSVALPTRQTVGGVRKAIQVRVKFPVNWLQDLLITFWFHSSSLYLDENLPPRNYNAAPAQTGTGTRVENLTRFRLVSWGYHVRCLVVQFKRTNIARAYSAFHNNAQGIVKINDKLRQTRIHSASPFRHCGLNMTKAMLCVLCVCAGRTLSSLWVKDGRPLDFGGSEWCVCVCVCVCVCMCRLAFFILVWDTRWQASSLGGSVWCVCVCCVCVCRLNFFIRVGTRWQAPSLVRHEMISFA